MAVVGILVANGAFLNLYINPKLLMIFSGNKELSESPPVVRLRKLSFALGAVSFVSWYSAFILGSLNFSPVGIPAFLLLYCLLLMVAIAGSQVMEYRFAKKRAMSF
jgi:hypothetical protein